jgi:hypothetical protein
MSYNWLFGFNIMAVLFAAFYDDLFVFGLSYLKAGGSSKFYDCSYSMAFTWEILWMQIQGVIVLQLHEHKYI